MSLRLYIMSAIAPLLLIVLYLAGGDLWSLKHAADRQEAIRDVAAETVIVSGLIHELQKERGFSAGFTASRGQNFPEALAQQRLDTDARVTRFRDGITLYRSLATEEIAAVTEGLEQLAERRGAIDRFATTVPELAGYYTGIINGLLRASGELRQRSGNDRIAILMEAADLVGQAKESAGLERAMGATGLGAEIFPDAVHKRFVDLGAAQLAFIAHAGMVLEQQDFVDTLLSLPAGEAIGPMRDSIAGLAYGGEVNFTAPEWFAASTEWIDTLREVEVGLINDLLTVAEAAHAATMNDLLLRGGLTAVLLATTAALALVLGETLTRRLRALTNVMNEFVEGRFEAWVPHIKARGEIGGMASSIYRFKQLSRAAIQKRERDEAQLNARHAQVVELMTDGLRALASADLTLNFKEPLAEEYDSIRHDFNTATARLREVMQSLAATVAELQSRSGDMRSSASDLADRTTTQVAMIARTAETVASLTETLAATSGALKDAKGLADEARGRADQSGQVVSNAVAAMDRISESSGRISQITTVIEDISFQTNLLALNAGVEAARAGESGKGFAVVAMEVQSLASRSADAALEIKKLLDESAVEVRGGVDLVGETGQSLAAILDQIRRVDRVISEVSFAAEGQARELQEINMSMRQLSDLTGQNTKVADSSRETASELEERSQHLGALLSEFDLGAADASMDAPKRLRLA